MNTLSAPWQDPARFDVLADDIANLRAKGCADLVSGLLGWGWRLDDLKNAPDIGVRAGAIAYERKLEANETTAIIAAILTMAAASLILAYGFAAPVLRGLA